MLFFLAVVAVVAVIVILIIVRRREMYAYIQQMPSPCLLFAIPIFILLLVALAVLSRHRRRPPLRGGAGPVNLCSAKGAAGNLDPLNDPAYNMQQAAKQSILLEEHLTQERKRCTDCQLKHLLHIQGLVEEAAMLAGDRAKTYPFLSESVEFYGRMLKLWTEEGKDDVDVQLSIATQLRDWRKKIAHAYYVAS